MRASRAALLAVLLAATPAGAAEILGQIEHPSDPAETRGLEVQLLGLVPDGEPVARDTRSDEQGRFRFRELQAPAAYLILVRYRGVGFHGESVRLGPEDGAATRELTVSVHVPSRDPGPIELERIRVYLEHEAGVYRLDQVVELRNTGDRVIVLDPEAPPALRIGLAPGHGELRTPTGLAPSGFQVVDDALELRGPLFPGPRELVFSYELQAPGAELDAELDFPDGAPALELYVRDDRLAIDVGDLHPARASRDSDGRTHQRYLGFDLPPGTTIPLRIRPLPPLASGGSWPIAAAAALLAGGLLYFVGRPLSAARRSESEPVEDPEAAEKEALFAALSDLEHDYETGKLSGGDRDSLREELRSSALAGIARARAAAAPAPRARTCSGCGRQATREDNFCAGCGAQL